MDASWFDCRYPSHPQQKILDDPCRCGYNDDVGGRKRLGWVMQPAWWPEI
jgi:hypothetical protein